MMKPSIHSAPTAVWQILIYRLRVGKESGTASEAGGR